MAKEILLYTPIYSYSAASFINEMEANKEEDICVRGNCPGGDMFSTYGMIAKFQEHTNKKEIKVDGIAASAFAYMLCFADKAECLDVSSFLFHRATYGDPEVEKTMDEGDRKILNKINASIRSAMESKVSSERFRQVTGYSYDDLFNPSQRIDVILNAQQASELGFISKVTPLTPSKRSEIMALSTSHGIAAFANQITTTENKEAMTAAEFKAANPTAYAEIFKEGVTAEQMRVKTWMAWSEIDPEAVTKGINEGKEIDPVVTAQFQVRAISKSKITAISADNPAPIATTDPAAAKTKEEEEIKAFKDEVKANLKKYKTN